MSSILNSTIHHKQYFKESLLTKYFKHFIFGRCPDNSKRIVYIASVVAVIKQIKDPDDKIINKLNEIFQLAKCSKAFIFPMYIKDFIWRNQLKGRVVVNGKELNIYRLNKQEYTDEEATAVGMYFNDRAPEWLRYGTREKMVGDIALLVKHALPV